MKKDLSPKYLSSSSYAKKHTIAIDSNLDPRLNSLTSNFKIARQNAEISIIGLNKSPQSFLLTMQNTGVFTPENPKPNDPSSELT